MQVQTLSIVTGSEACQARCPFCVSKMTPPNGIVLKQPTVNWRNFRKALHLAKMWDVTTVLFTGKGEPTLFPQQISDYLLAMQEFEFPFIEMQTNGIELAENAECRNYLREWYKFGLTTVAISVVHYEAEKNRQIYTPYRDHYYDLRELIDRLHEMGLSVRLSAVLINGFLDSVEEIKRFIVFASEAGVEQVSLRPVNSPVNSRDESTAKFVEDVRINPDSVEAIRAYLDTDGTKVLQLIHGAYVYDLHGQNVCLTDCLTLSLDKNYLRQLIYFPDGHLRYDWQYKGAILL